MLVDTPPEEHLVGLDINLVSEAVPNPPIPGSAYRAQISFGDIDRRDQDGAVLGQSDLVGIDTRVELLLLLLIVARDDILFVAVQRDAVDFVVRAVQDTDVSVAKAAALEALPVREHGLAV